jgi:hypothetical protein
MKHTFGPVVGTDFEDAFFFGAREEADTGRRDWERSESIVGRMEGGKIASVKMFREWIPYIWRSPSGRCYAACDSFKRGGVLRFEANPGLGYERWEIGSMQRVFGIDDDFVVACGGTGANARMKRFDGTSWVDMPSPGEVNSIHGISPDHLIAGGIGGQLWRWDGAQWHEMASDLRGLVSSIFVVSKTEAYAAGAMGRLFEGSEHGWVERASLDWSIFSIAVYAGRVLAACGNFGLYELKNDKLEMASAEVFPFWLHPGRTLLMNEGSVLSQTADFSTFQRVTIADLEVETSRHAPQWKD